ncbi:hypothetical protein PLICRDRAFT_216643 [Plicaturopsis crispa FD-325 SS-3]|nr:hypothetical protein PLICRDRAFT_216643 [Plicaturopsis crispa FD-325 SS-3]
MHGFVWDFRWSSVQGRLCERVFSSYPYACVVLLTFLVPVVPVFNVPTFNCSLHQARAVTLDAHSVAIQISFIIFRTHLQPRRYYMLTVAFGPAMRSRNGSYRVMTPVTPPSSVSGRRSTARLT